LKRSRRFLAPAIVIMGILVGLFAYVSFSHHEPALSLIKQPENTVLKSSRELVIPQNQSSVISAAEQASFVRNGKDVNVTVVRTISLSAANSLFQTLRASYVAQDLHTQNLTLTGQSLEFYGQGRPYLILLTKSNYVEISVSNDEALALDSARAQITGLN